ncbi:MAG: tRNA pseudouridine(55) synthase TruB [Bacteroidota bacterium]
MDTDPRTAFLEGQVLLIDKPLGWTSFDVVNKIRSAFNRSLGIRKIKVGHAGTLDPLATGLVIICTGKATRRINSFMDLQKEYEATFRLGATTPSFDLETETDKTYPTEHITMDMIRAVAEGFIGESDQVPPLFSAKFIDGKRAYEFARAGKDIELKARTVTIEKILIRDYTAPDLSLSVSCSKGTYIRALARDFGEKLGSGAHLIMLRRTRIGDFSVDQAETVNNFIEKLKLL